MSPTLGELIDELDDYYIGSSADPVGKQWIEDRLGESSDFSNHYNSLVSDKTNLVEQVSALTSDKEDLREIIDILADKEWTDDRIETLADDMILSQQTITSLQSEKINLTENLESKKLEYDLVIAERDALLSAQEQDGTDGIFHYVNWKRANKRKNFYKDVNWSAIPFDALTEAEIENIDWSEVLTEQAEQAETFDISFIDVEGWTEVNSSGKGKKEIYNDLNWQEVDYQNLSVTTRSGIDWSRVDYKEAILAINEQGETIFNLDAVDIEELKSKNNAFKRFLKATSLRTESAASLLAAASSETLEAIGLNNYTGKKFNKRIRSISTDFADYSLIMKKCSYDRASAIAKGMGGTLAVLETGEETESFVDELTGFIQRSKRAARILNPAEALTGTSSFNIALGSWQVSVFKDQEESDIRVYLDTWSTVEDSKWFVVEMPEPAAVIPDDSPVDATTNPLINLPVSDAPGEI